MKPTKLLLLMGPTGCGKTTMARCLEDLDNRFKYIYSFTTRALREGEKDRVSVTDDEMTDLWSKHKLVVVNNLYGAKYGTPRAPIESAFETGCFPVIDWPIQRLHAMEEFSDRLLRVYLKPPSVRVLADRLKERSDQEERLRFAETELRELEQGSFDKMIDLLVTNETGRCKELARTIHEYYMKAIQSEVEH